MSRDAAPEVTAAEITAELRAAIARGDYAPGDRLPGENALMDSHGVARMTARKALAQLQAEGLTVTRRGIGVFVRDFKPVVRNGIARLASRPWEAGTPIWEEESQGRTLEVDSLTVEPTADAPDDVARILALPAGAKACRRDRRYVLDGKPVMLATSYLPAELVAGTPITDPNPGAGGIYARLAELGRAPVHFREDLAARMPTPDQVEALQLEPGTPVVTIDRIAVDADGHPLEINRMTLDAAAYVIRYDFDA